MKEIDIRKYVFALSAILRDNFRDNDLTIEEVKKILTTIYNKGKEDERGRIANEIYEELLPIGSFDGFDLVKQIKSFYEKLLKQQ